MGVTVPLHGPYDFSCRRSGHGGIELRSVTFCQPMHVYTGCALPQVISVLATVSPSNYNCKDFATR